MEVTFGPAVAGDAMEEGTRSRPCWPGAGWRVVVSAWTPAAVSFQPKQPFPCSSWSRYARGQAEALHAVQRPLRGVRVPDGLPEIKQHHTGVVPEVLEHLEIRPRDRARLHRGVLHDQAVEVVRLLEDGALHRVGEGAVANVVGWTVFQVAP